MDDLAAERSAREIMERFAHRTGLSGERPQRRYLWTDAFAVCNYLTLFRRTGDRRFADLAQDLIRAVHLVLGRHRPDDARRGWISGLGEAEGERHPTLGGLRIGKPLPERGPAETFDAKLEWDRDGQYYHYLLRWMHALARAGAVLEDADLRQWAAELAIAAQRGFTATSPDGAPRMAWKMSIDLSRPLVPSQGAHDPLDGCVTSCVVEGGGLADAGVAEDLRRAVHELAAMCRPDDWVTNDPLGVGGLLCDVWWSAQLVTGESDEKEILVPMLGPMIAAALLSLRGVSITLAVERSRAERLAFRELGLAIGLRATAQLAEAAPDLPAHLRAPAIDEMIRHVPVADRIVSTWLDPRAVSSPAWRSHEDINEVMLATALLPDEHLRA